MNTLIEPTRILDYIRDLLPWAHVHQIKSIATFVVAIIEKQGASDFCVGRVKNREIYEILRSCKTRNSMKSCLA